MTPGEAYKILGISDESDLEAIKGAYREKSLQFHPDRQTAMEKSSDSSMKQKI
jgi:DnaJ-class molecular chaperone